MMLLMRCISPDVCFHFARLHDVDYACLLPIRCASRSAPLLPLPLPIAAAAAAAIDASFAIMPISPIDAFAML